MPYPSHGRGHRFNPCAAHQQNQRLTSPRFVLLHQKFDATKREQTRTHAQRVQKSWVGWGDKQNVAAGLSPAALDRLRLAKAPDGHLHHFFVGGQP